jgi:hypothetical protein
MRARKSGYRIRVNRIFIRLGKRILSLLASDGEKLFNAYHPERHYMRPRCRQSTQPSWWR